MLKPLALLKAIPPIVTGHKYHLLKSSFNCSLNITSAITDRNAIIKLPFSIVGVCTATIISNANTVGTLYGGNNSDTLVRDIGSIPAASFSVYGSYATND